MEWEAIVQHAPNPVTHLPLGEQVRQPRGVEQ